MKKLRINVNTTTLSKTAGLISNSVLLTANAFLIGSQFTAAVRDRKRERIAGTLQMTAEIASSIAGLTKVVTETLVVHHVPGD